MKRLNAATEHEVRLRAAYWARRLVRDHGGRAETVVRATLKRRDLTDHERFAARCTKQALSNLRRTQAYAPRTSPRMGVIGSMARILTARWQSRPNL